MAPGEIYGRCTPIPELWSLPGAGISRGISQAVLPAPPSTMRFCSVDDDDGNDDDDDDDDGRARSGRLGRRVYSVIIETVEIDGELDRRVVRSCIDVFETRVLVGSSDEYVRIHTLARRSKEQEEEEAKKKTKKTKKEEKVEVEEEEEDARPRA
ncbi:hypothetical protein K0M31_014622 [Melipona bicolor]|uniref:Uncharacterized protein n=1 Tax=Melipona bicolor TaxID=60889 RepID=A0AA40FGY6_9HYME|nr:hypothetical protein K0M31_014622 [Melipona bicolor]